MPCGQSRKDSGMGPSLSELRGWPDSSVHHPAFQRVCFLAARSVPGGLLMAELAWKTDTTASSVSPLNQGQINSRRRREKIFVALGIGSVALALLTLAALLIDLAIAGFPRLSFDFFTSFPSRRAAQAGILSAWVGSLLVILVTATVSIPL